MRTKLIGMLLAATVSCTALAACHSPAQTAYYQATEGAAPLLALEREMGDYELLAHQATSAGYGVMAAPDAVGTAAAPIPDEVRARLAEQLASRTAASGARLARLADVRARIAEKAKSAPWVDNGDGTETQDIDFEAPTAGHASRAVALSRTRSAASGDVVSASVTFSKATNGGQSKNSTRTRTLNADGSRTITFWCEHVLPNGMTRTADWSKTVGLDGGATGSGAITWHDASGAMIKQSAVVLGGTEDAPAADTGDENVELEEDSEPPADEAGDPASRDKGQSIADEAKARAGREP